jgi:predicted GIY-YIG superfamily endonuclease
MRNRKYFWNKEECTKEALKYNSKVDFVKHCMSAYNSAIRNGWLEEITKHMVRPVNSCIIWNKEACRLEALKYPSRVDFQKKSGSAYVSAHTNGWLDDICQHMQRPANSRIIWNEETCRTEALKFETKKEFVMKSSGAYNMAKKLGIFDDICSHMKICGSLMLRCVYAYEFPDNHVYIGLTFNSDLRHIQHLTHTKSQVYRYIANTGLIPAYKVLSEYVDVHIAMKLEREILNKYIQNGWLKLNVAQTGGIGWIKLPKEEKN